METGWPPSLSDIWQISGTRHTDDRHGWLTASWTRQGYSRVLQELDGHEYSIVAIWQHSPLPFKVRGYRAGREIYAETSYQVGYFFPAALRNSNREQRIAEQRGSGYRVSQKVFGLSQPATGCSHVMYRERATRASTRDKRDGTPALRA